MGIIAKKQCKGRDTLYLRVHFFESLSFCFTTGCSVFAEHLPTPQLTLNSGINLANSLTEPVETRLAKFILLHEEKGVFTHQLTTCAAVLNVSYRHLLRTITNFRENRILEKQKSKYSDP